MQGEDEAFLLGQLGEEIREAALGRRRLLGHGVRVLVSEGRDRLVDLSSP